MKKPCLFLCLLLASPLLYAQTEISSLQTEAKRVRAELTDAFNRSEKYSMAIAKQMPAQYYTFRSTDSTFTYAEQWRHLVVFTTTLLSGKLGVKNPYDVKKMPEKMDKDEMLTEIKEMYAFVRKTIQELPAEKLFDKTPFTDESIPNWRFIYAMENHIIHHRGQCIVYLRLKGIVPEGYVGW